MEARAEDRRYREGKQPAWRPFQLAFVLMSLAAMADPAHVDRKLADLIYFPTGGGKTEAYLGLIAYTLILRRLRGKQRRDEGRGVTVLLRYTLWLLTLDQLGRAATLMCALEEMRRRDPKKLGNARFTVGLWVGRGATANRLKEVHAALHDTAVVLRSLFEGAEREVILAGFSFEKGSSVLEPLYRAMCARPLDVRFFVHVEQVQGASVDAHAHVEREIAAFLRDARPFGDPTPQLYYDKRALVPGPPWSSLHAKCVVVDGERALVSSANFSLRAQEHNIEAGVLLHDRAFAHHLARQWLGLIEAHLV